MASNLWIVVVNFNGLEDTRKCLRSIAAGPGDKVSTVLVDNASAEDPTAPVRFEFPWCHLVRNSANGGWAGGNNTGIRYALQNGAERVLLLNNDTVVAPGLADRLEEAARVYPRLGVLGPIINFLEEPDVVMTDGCTFNEAASAGFFQRKPVPVSASRPPTVTEVDVVNGCAMMVNVAVFRRVGLIDERFFLVHEESDFCLRARRAGFRCGVIGDVLVWHKDSSSFKRAGKRLQRYYDTRNLYLLLKKHVRPHSRRRGVLSSRLEYLKYVYYRYAIECENGHPEAADAVLQGFCDALAGDYGPFAPRPRLALPVFRLLFSFWRRQRAG